MAFSGSTIREVEKKVEELQSVLEQTQKVLHTAERAERLAPRVLLVAVLFGGAVAVAGAIWGLTRRKK